MTTWKDSVANVWGCQAVKRKTTDRTLRPAWKLGARNFVLFDFFNQLASAVHSTAASLVSDPSLGTSFLHHPDDASAFLFVQPKISMMTPEAVIVAAAPSAQIEDPQPSSKSHVPHPHSFLIASEPSPAIAEPESAMSRFVRSLSYVSVVSDSALIAAMLYNLHNACDAHLLSWGMGALGLSFPSSYLVDWFATKTGSSVNISDRAIVREQERIQSRKAFRRAFVVEAGLMMVSFGWLCYGFVLMGNGPTCVNTSPFLFWTSFVQATLGLSITGTGIFFMITATVLSVLYGQTDN